MPHNTVTVATTPHNYAYNYQKFWHSFFLSPRVTFWWILILVAEKLLFLPSVRPMRKRISQYLEIPTLFRPNGLNDGSRTSSYGSGHRHFLHFFTKIKKGTCIKKTEGATAGLFHLSFQALVATITGLKAKAGTIIRNREKSNDENPPEKVINVPFKTNNVFNSTMMASFLPVIANKKYKQISNGLTFCSTKFLILTPSTMTLVIGHMPNIANHVLRHFKNIYWLNFFFYFYTTHLNVRRSPGIIFV